MNCTEESRCAFDGGNLGRRVGRKVEFVVDDVEGRVLRD